MGMFCSKAGAGKAEYLKCGLGLLGPSRIYDFIFLFPAEAV